MLEIPGASPNVVGQKKPNEWGILDIYGNVSDGVKMIIVPTI